MEALVFEAETRAADVRRRLQQDGPLFTVVLLSQGDSTRAYVFLTQLLALRVEGVADGRTLAEALPLADEQPAQVCAEDEGFGERNAMLAPIVVMRGRKVLGVCYPPALAPNPPQVLREMLEQAAPTLAPNLTTPARREPAPAFKAYPALTMPEQVAVGTVFDLEIDLSPDAVPGTISEGISLSTLPPEVKVLEFDLQVRATGMEILTDLIPRLRVDRSTCKAQPVTVTLRVTAAALEYEKLRVKVHFSYQGHYCGYAIRNVTLVTTEPRVEAGTVALLPPAPSLSDPTAIQAPGTMPAERPQAPAVRQETGALFMALLQAPVDLTLMIEEEETRPNRFTCSLLTPHLGPNVAVDDAVCELEDRHDPDAFANWLSQRMQGSVLYSPQTDRTLRGLGTALAAAIPDEVWEKVRQVAKQVRATEKRAATMLICSRDTHVPWELCRLDGMEENDPTPFLGAHLAVGRLPLQQTEDPAEAQRRLATHLDLHAMTVIWSSYGTQLPRAKDEAQLLKDYGAGEIAAKQEPVLNFLDFGPVTGLVHFTGHGTVSQGLKTAQLPLEDGVLDSLWILDQQARFRSGRPFVFLNACQVGQSVELDLGRIGIIDTLVDAGCTGCVGALWNIRDEAAPLVAREFYSRTLDEKEPASVGEALMEIRRKVKDGPPYDATYLAYVYYGHPGLKLHRAKEMDKPWRNGN